MYSKSDNVEIMSNDKGDEVIKSLLNKHEIGLKKSMNGSNFTFYCVHLLYYKCHKINGWIIYRFSRLDKKEKTTINRINKTDNEYFQYDVTVALNHEQIQKNSQRIAKIKPFTDKYIGKGVNYPLEIDDWIKYEKNNQ